MVYAPLIASIYVCNSSIYETVNMADGSNVDFHQAFKFTLTTGKGKGNARLRAFRQVTFYYLGLVPVPVH